MAGRPSKYKPEFAQQAAKLCALGATDAELAEFFGVSVRTLHRWKLDDEQFCHSIKAAKLEADDRIERALYARASGFEYKEQQAIKVKTGNGGEEKIEIVEVERIAPPDTTAMIFWLKNRKPEEWREKVDHTLANPDGSALNLTVQFVKP